ncbi:GNAT family N-acetyltransferase [Streptomyces sp. TLI_171]|uniref:GNAT family N-acetyltransferase n=1 Tax=Streptomyces sp. TLI_171 TaxID=1938859 RepID=UPI000C17A10E|nr:GNAT family protein [Streptomyces sp. TLI_171]RKE16995.1 RimJ/RimL family protein N-acetyltransferase [Streptomyces sp. TLI_171]
MPTDHWPLPGLRVRSPRLELRLPTEHELAELADAAAEHGVVTPGTRPFRSTWAYGTPTERARAVLRATWRSQADWTPEAWALLLTVFLDGRPIGVQSIRATDFAVRRETLSGSWLTLPHHGRGLGTEARSAVLHLAFAGLHAEDATSASYTDNPASIAVSRRLGYRPDGLERENRHGEPATTQRFRLTRTDWEATARPEVHLAGVAACAELFGM